ncbi:hypothetical protein RvY_16638 [Ramazzottius varieornatus]|uniref:Uncharacterized protein n=1 Tax=Ramazzottius varieornatus TaxID=947166 RepID=A0A1D1VZ74_RAMVA|nr:hypothetical protein RvY_16638 [Ramazzottius varieornatus]
MEAAQFFLGDALNDEAYSALESLFNFIALKEYQVYHSYNSGYRIRPFADYSEFVGPIFNFLPASATVDTDVDPSVPVLNCPAPTPTPSPY